MARLLLILALVAVVFWVYTVVDCALQPATRHRGVGKPAWIAIVILLPVIGGVLWFTIGRGRKSAATRKAPDDDPDFLRTLGKPSDQDERIRRLEEELARLDDEDAQSDPPRGGTPAPRRPADGDDDAHTG